jgi:hypothetical protein
VLFDLLFLNYKILSPTPPSQGKTQEVATLADTSAKEDNCGQDCQDEIDKVVSEALSQRSSTQIVTSGGSSGVKEYYVPFGTGISTSSEWEDVPGLQAYIDKSAYGSIKKVTFEASVRVPTGNQTAEVQLFNITAKHPVWSSQVTFTGGGTPQLLISDPITLDSGNNLYKVQMKTQLKYPAYLDQARVHIITN